MSLRKIHDEEPEHKNKHKAKPYRIYEKKKKKRGRNGIYEEEEDKDEENEDEEEESEKPPNCKYKRVKNKYKNRYWNSLSEPLRKWKWLTIIHVGPKFENEDIDTKDD